MPHDPAENSFIHSLNWSGSFSLLGADDEATEGTCVLAKFHPQTLQMSLEYIKTLLEYWSRSSNNDVLVTGFSNYAMPISDL